MKIIAYLASPTALKNAIDKKINDSELRTWEIVKNDNNEVLYSHIPEQGKEKAMLKPKILIDRIEFEVKWWSKNVEPDESTKCYITGRFVEILMVHFRKQFSQLEIK